MSKKGHSAMQLSRRDFLKFSIPATAGLAVLGGVPGAGLVEAAAKIGPPELVGDVLLYDATLCQGTNCRACTNGCREWNKLAKPPTGKDPKVVELGITVWTSINDVFIPKPGGVTEHHFFKNQCRHCTNASCVAGCPTGAMGYHGEYVVVDPKMCIGCGFCVEACPFGVPQLGVPKSVAQKCRFCIDRLQSKDPDINGKNLSGYVTTACEARCPVRPIKALRFGNRPALIAYAKKRVATLIAGGNKGAHLYGEHELGGLHLLFILDQPDSFYGLPEARGMLSRNQAPPAPRFAAASVGLKWGTGVATAGLAILPFWLLFKRKQELASKKSGVQGGEK